MPCGARNSFIAVSLTTGLASPRRVFPLCYRGSRWLEVRGLLHNFSQVIQRRRWAPIVCFAVKKPYDSTNIVRLSFFKCQWHMRMQNSKYERKRASGASIQIVRKYREELIPEQFCSKENTRPWLVSIGMLAMQQNTEQTFVVDLLTTLRCDCFSLRAWGNFCRRSWLLSCQTAKANPSLKRSWQRVTILSHY